MWLIEASTLSLEAFNGDAVPPYAILSHTWEDEEVSFQEFIKASESQGNTSSITRKAGYRKLVAVCELAQREGYHYVWVDTCCIDKNSSAELTEAINSMFGWYRDSQICYAYLSDFESGIHFTDSSPQSQRKQFAALLRKCKWFTRGWCLQELLAPIRTCFLNRRWEKIGTRHLLSRLISDITGIPPSVLTTPPKNKISNFPIAARISWISQRQTTRVEDMSYSLFGILEVNMPTIYGEGHAAFIRLQGEIIRKYNDLSIFSFVGRPNLGGFMPILAQRPKCFVIDSSASPYKRESYHAGNQLGTQFSLTNQGVFFPNATLRYQRVAGYRHQYLLDLHYLGRHTGRRYLLLQKIGPGIFLRIHNSKSRQSAFKKVAISGPFNESVRILHRVPRIMLLEGSSQWERNAVRLRWKPWDRPGRRFYHVRVAEPRANWDLAANQFLVQLGASPEMHIEFAPGCYSTNPGMKSFILIIRVYKEDQNLKRIKAQIVSAETWNGASRTELGFRGNGLSEIPYAQGTETSSISIVGYDIKMRVDLVRERGQLDYHLIYLDWELTDVTRQAEASTVVTAMVLPSRPSEGLT